MKEFKSIHAEALYLRFSAIYGDKFIKSYHTDEFKKIWYEEWRSGLFGIDVSLIKDCLDYCKSNLEWPPSIAEFRKICEKSSGIPDINQALEMAIRREFTHPIVSLAYDKVGSWSMKNDKQSVLLTKFRDAYTEALNKFRFEPVQAWKALDDRNADRQKALPEPSKIPSETERLTFKENMAKWKAIAESQKNKNQNKEHTVWDQAKVTRSNKYFDQKMYDERREYLINVNETDANNLCRENKYDRICFLHEDEAHTRIKNYLSTRPVDSEPKSSKRAPYGARKVNEYWNT